MKFKASWFLNGTEVELPEMKIEGSLAVAELMKKHVDDFLPFILTMQEESTLRLRTTVLNQIKATTPPNEAQAVQLQMLCKIYNIPYAEGVVDLLLQRAIDDLNAHASKAARSQITSTPFFLERSILEAYYMLKAYIFEQARKDGKKPVLPFTLDDLKTLITDDELAVFAKHSMDRMKTSAPEEPSLEMPSEEDVKKKLQTNPIAS